MITVIVAITCIFVVIWTAIFAFRKIHKMHVPGVFYQPNRTCNTCGQGFYSEYPSYECYECYKKRKTINGP